METRGRSDRLRGVVGICVALALAGIIYLGYFCPDHVCALTNRSARDGSKLFEGLPTSLSLRPIPPSINIDKMALFKVEPPSNLKGTQVNFDHDNILNNTFSFDVKGHDVMVFLHIQKTGGTFFGKHLVRDLVLQRPCSCQRRKKRCYCFRPNRNENWLFSRYSTGWKCGLHADWTELTNCVDHELNKIDGDNIKRKYFYITILRDPIARYLSEFRHVQRGATWRSSRHWCSGSLANIPQCYDGPNWHGVTLEQFLACPTNLASNRQTRMLADLSLVGCYNSTLTKTDKDELMLRSAIRNLQIMPFFMLTEYQKMGQYSFEETFGMRFAVPFEQHNSTLSAATIATLTHQELDDVKRMNELDLQLYEFAKNLVLKRFRHLRDRDPDFNQRFSRLGELTLHTRAEFDWDSAIENSTDDD